MFISENMIVIGSAVLCFALIILLRPWFLRYLLAKPNLRSSHREPTPQGGGIAVVAATSVIVWLVVFIFPIDSSLPTNSSQFAWLLAATVLMTVVGTADDIRPLYPLSRLLLQLAAIIIVVASTPAELRPVNFLPWWVERVLLVIGALWFVNLVNFMDGADWMTVAEIVPVTGALVLLGWMSILPSSAMLVALALLGAMLGFAPFNRPVAKLFLGDAGSLPIGLLLGWLLMMFATTGYIIEAFILPLYYLADATVTLFRRIFRGANLFEAHRDHFYQHAIDHGFSAGDVVVRVFTLNVCLGCLSIAPIFFEFRYVMRLVALAVAILLVTALLMQFARVKGGAAPS